MTLPEFIQYCDLVSGSEVEKAVLLAYYYLKVHDHRQFSARDVASWFCNAGLASPNTSRLRRNLLASRRVVRGSEDGSFRIPLETLQELERRYPDVCESDAVESHGSVLPEAVFVNTRGYIESVCRQINACWEKNIFDGCAVLMRRLLEILLVLSYRHLGIEATITRADGNLVGLESIVDDAKQNRQLALSRTSKANLETFRQLGNFSAHQIEYVCRRHDLTPVLREFRVCVEELLNKAGLVGSGSGR